jgi:CDP-diacylglycerol--serine O-phosphatidyltransferase
MDEPTEARTPRRAIYLLPNLFTTGGMFAGFYAIVAAINGQPVTAAISVFVAAVLDGLDGRVARMTNTQSEFGVQYDSLADLISFGLAPSLVLYTWSLAGLKAVSPMAGKIGWCAAFLYAACAAIRLARFNVQVGVVDKRYFVGLASPAAAGLMMSYVWAMNEFDFPGRDLNVEWLSVAVAVTAGLLMVSRIRYWSFKGSGGKDRVHYWVLPAIVGVLVLLGIFQHTMLLLMGVAYAASGPLMWLYGRFGRKAPPAA